MKKCKLKIITVLAGVLCMLSFSLPALAAEEEPEIQQWDGTTPEGASFLEDSWVPRARGTVFNRAYIKLVDLDGKAGVYGETLARVDADEIGLNLYLEKYNGTSYDNYQYWKTVEYNNHQNVKGYTVSVPKGYYYRLRGFHYVDANGIYENGSTMTDGLKIPQ